jgi:hypothetical protein
MPPTPSGMFTAEEAERLADHRAHVQRLIDVALDASENLPLVAINQLIDGSMPSHLRQIRLVK